MATQYRVGEGPSCGFRSRPRARLAAACAIAISVLTNTAGNARGAGVAYWRFGESSAGTEFAPPPTDGGPGSGLAVDETGNGNSLRTFSAGTNPVYSASVPGSQVPQTVQANPTSLNFTPNEDLYCDGCGINAVDFDRFTVEASFMVDNVTRYHGLVGKDGSPVGGNPLSSLQLKVRDDNDLLQTEILDGAGNGAQVSSLNAIVPGRWYNAAAVNDGSTLSLYLDDTSDAPGYVLQGSVALTPAGGDGLFDHTGTFTVGRGFFNNGIADWTDGNIDEVRISDVALAPSQFLFTVPEPASAGLLLCGALLALSRRRNC